jgi:plastocyanin
MKKLILLLLFAACFVVICGCTQSSPQPADTPVPTHPPTSVVTATRTYITATPVLTPERTVSVSDNTITIVKNAFSPANMTVKAGSTVRWVNGDDHPHRIEFVNKAFSTSAYLLGSSQSASQRFDKPGTYDYDCMIHPYMKGTITVVE